MDGIVNTIVIVEEVLVIQKRAIASVRQENVGNIVNINVTLEVGELTV